MNILTYLLFLLVNPFVGLFQRRNEPVRLHKKQSWKEKHEADLILLGGFFVIFLLFIFAFCFVGQMDQYNNGGI